MPYVPPDTARNECEVDVPLIASQAQIDAWRQPLLANEDIRVVAIQWPPGFRSIPHHHPHATETFHVVSGMLGLRLDDRAELIVASGGIAIAHRGQVHGLRVLGDEPLLFLAIVAPNEDVEDEQVDVPDRWPDWVGAVAPVGMSR